MQAWGVLPAPPQGILSTAIRNLDEQACAQAITDQLLQPGTTINTFWMWVPPDRDSAGQGWYPPC
jgi:hypothetical protein